MQRALFFCFILTLALLNFSCSIDDVNVSPYPVVKIVSPTSTSQILDTTTIVLDASDDRGVARVELYIDGRIPTGGRMLYVPYQYTWDTSTLSDTSQHQIYAKAYDTDSNVTVTPTLTVTIYKFQPTNLVAILVGDSVVSLSWRDNCSKETGYQVVEQGSDSIYQLVATLPPNTTTVDLPGTYLTTQSYTYMVRAEIDSLRSKFSNKQTVTPLVTAPAELVVFSVSDTVIRLNWQIRLHSIAQFIDVEESQNSGPFSVVKTLPVSTDSLDLIGQYNTGISYRFRTIGYTARNNKSVYSNIATVQFYLDAPSGLRGVALSPTLIRLQWQDNSGIEKQFSIERKTATTNFAEVGRVGTNITLFTDTGLDTNETYTYRVRALTDVNRSPYSLAATLSYLAFFSEAKSIHADNHPIEGVAFVGATNHVITSGSNNTAVMWDALTGNQIGSFDGSPAPITSLAMNAQGTLLVTGSSDGTILLWDVPTLTVTRSIHAFTSTITSVSLSPDGQYIAGVCATSVLLRTWSAADGNLLWSDSAHTDMINSAMYSSDGSTVFSCSYDQTIKQWNAANGLLVRTINKPFEYFRSLAVNSTADIIVAGSSSYINPLNAWRLSTGTALSGFTVNGSGIAVNSIGNAVALSSTGDTLVCGYSDYYVRVWGGADRGLLEELAGHANYVRAVQFNRTGDIIASGSADGVLKIWQRGKTWK